VDLESGSDAAPNTGEFVMLSRIRWNSRAVAGALLAAAIVTAGGLAAPAHAARLGIEIAPVAPPAPYVETIPPAPGAPELYAWIPGRWHWDGHRYGWTHGAWRSRAYAGAIWGPGGWRHHHDGWRWSEGQWRRP
jgi:WXXGXW repeat (2 copies)